MPYEVGDVVPVRFPFTDQSASKRRPGVVVSNRTYNAARLDVVVMPITSQLRATPASGEICISQ
jgi:mRNA interferase MazF